MSADQIARLQQQLRDASAAVLASVEGCSEEEAHQVPAPGEWTVAQLLAHIAEIQGFWMSKAVLITKEEDPQITRTDVENDIRQEAVDDHSGDPLDSLINSVKEATMAAVDETGRINPANLGRPGHRQQNPITVAGVIEYLAEHVALHAQQITDSRRLIAGA